MIRAVAGVMATIVLLAVAGCSGGEEASVPPPQEMVPEGVNLIAQLHVDMVVDDQDIHTLYEAMSQGDPDAPATFQELLDSVLEEVGIDLKAFSRAVLFVDTEREGFFALIAQGTFDREELLRDIEEIAGGRFSTTDYRGYELHTFAAGGGSSGLSDLDTGTLVFLDDDSLVIGLAEAVQEVVDVKEGDRQALTGPVMDRYNALGDPWIKVAMEVSASGLEDIPEVASEVPFDLSFIGDIRVVGVSLDKSGEDFQARLAMDFTSADSASRTGDTIGGLLGLLRSFLADARARDLLGAVQVTTSGATLTISFEASATELQSLMESPPDMDMGGIFQ